MIMSFSRRPQLSFPRRPQLSFPRRRESSPEKGFTLIELIIVIVLIGILSIGIVSAKYSGAPKVQTYANQVANTFRYVQNLALTKDEPYRMTFIFNAIILTTGDGLTTVSFPGRQNNILRSPSGYTMTISGAPNGYLIYNKDGEPYTDASLTTPLSSDATVTITGDGITKTLTISGVTGVVLNPN